MKKIIQGIIAFSLKSNYLVLFLTAVVAGIGVWSYLNTPIEAFPDVTNTRVQIITQWPGRSAEELEKRVTIPIETEMNVVPGKTSLRSISLFGLSVVTMIFDDNVEDFTARQNVYNRLSAVDLPDGAEAEVQPPSGPTGEIYRYTLQSKTLSIRDLKTVQDWIIDRNLKGVDGVADVVSFGGEVKTYEVAVDPSLLAKYNITPLKVYEAIEKSNINVGGDVVTKNGQAYVVRGIGLLDSLDDIQNVIVDNISGTPILLKNIADVHEAALPRLGQVGRGPQTDLVEGIVLMRKGENPSKVITALELKVDELNNGILPADVRMNVFYDRANLVSITTHTVIHNLLEGVALVTIIVLIFMADWRTTVTVAVIIPLALLFAFICMRIKGMSANLLSMGAIDFGIIVDGAVVMVEGIFVALDHRAHQLGMERFNKSAKLGIIKRTGTEMGKSIFFSKLIIITALLPIFAFQKVEGKMFSPLAWTLGFALLGALIFTLTLVPALCGMLLRKNVRERKNFIVDPIVNGYAKLYELVQRNKRITSVLAASLMVGGFGAFSLLGTEFLPHLNEGAIYVRASLPLSISLPESVKMTKDMRHIFGEFAEVRQVMSQTGRPNDGTDPTGFFNVEFFVDIYPKEEWKRHVSLDELIAQMQARLAKYPGVIFGFSQPISDNVEEAVSGVKGSLAVKVFGYNLTELQNYATKVYATLKNVRGVEDLGIVQNIGQPELRIELDQNKMALYGVTAADAQSVVEMAIGGKAASKFYEQQRRFDIRIRYRPESRATEADIAELKIPTMNGSLIPIKEIARIRTITGPAFIYREGNTRFIAVKFSVRGRDLGGTIQEAQAKMAKAVQLNKGYKLTWNGEFENQVRATKTLTLVVPISLLLIFLILFATFGNGMDALLVLMNVPFALIGGILALLITHTNFSISAGVGFIALFGVCVQNGVILISVFKNNLHEGMNLPDSIRVGAVSRVRPVVMTALMAMIGLLPAAISTGIGSETQKPLAIVVIGGLVSATILTLVMLPMMFGFVYKLKHRR